MGKSRLRIVVADTSTLVGPAVPRADAAYGTGTVPDPFQYLLTSCGVAVPPEVIAELRDMAQHQNIHGVAATNVLAVRTHYTVDDPRERDNTPESRPTFGLDNGKTDGIVLANALDVGGFLTGEFDGTNFALIHAVLQGPRIVPTPRLLCGYARNDRMAHEETRTFIETVSPYRGWENSPYTAQLLALLE